MADAPSEPEPSPVSSSEKVVGEKKSKKKTKEGGSTKKSTKTTDGDSSSKKDKKTKSKKPSPTSEALPGETTEEPVETPTTTESKETTPETSTAAGTESEKPSLAGATSGSLPTGPVSTKSAKKHIPMMCGCCKSFVRVPRGASKFTCVLCRVVTFTKASQKDELKALYEKYDWSDYVKQVRCPRCQLETYIPKRAFMFSCYDCGSINDSDGLRLGVRRNGSQDHAAVFGLSKLSLETPWLFWSFFFKGAMTDDNLKHPPSKAK